MAHWLEQLTVDPIPELLSAQDEALVYFVRRELVQEDVEPVECLWVLPQVRKLLKKQQANGSWRYPGKNQEVYPEIKYDLLETFRSINHLVGKYGFHIGHPSIEKAARYILTCQTEEGDIRGILGTQYMPYYHGVIIELLINAGYGDDTRVEKGLEWLLSMRQDDGGWIVPMQAVPAKEKTRDWWSGPPLPPDRRLPFSHLATGMALRAFAVHPNYRHRSEVRSAGAALKSRFFRSDKYGDRKAPLYWTKFQYPFWWSNLLTALDSLSRIGFSVDDKDIQEGLDWFVSHQKEDGLWDTSYELAKRREVSPKERSARLWVSFAICRVFKRLHG
jgi:hypothetical protein